MVIAKQILSGLGLRVTKSNSKGDFRGITASKIGKLAFNPSRARAKNAVF